MLVTVLLARNRPPPPPRPIVDFTAELVSLQSGLGLLAMVCDAIGKLRVRIGGRLCVRAWGCVYESRDCCCYYYYHYYYNCCCCYC